MTVLATSSLRYIQIHLMLLFICQEKKHPARESAFKYISCYCLSLSPCNLGVIHSYSNTSHVIVYRLRPSLTFQEIYIQIHLMLLFIVLHPISFCRYLDSNTSHVIVYPIRIGVLWFWMPYSNTSHVIVYQYWRFWKVF